MAQTTNTKKREKSFPIRPLKTTWKSLIDLNSDQTKKSSEVVPLNETINQVLDAGLLALKSKPNTNIAH